MDHFELIEKSIKETESKLFNEVKNKYGWYEKKLKKDISEIEFGLMIYDCLKKCLVHDEEVKSNFPIAKKFESRAHNFLSLVLVDSDFNYFKEAVKAFEKIVNTENVMGKTALFHTILLRTFGASDLKNNERKIEYICASSILNAKDNLSDKKADEVTNDFYLGLSEYYSRVAIDALVVLSKFHENKIITENYFPDMDNRLLSGLDASGSASMAKMSQIDVKKIHPELLINKLSLSFIKDFQNQLVTGRLKSGLLELISEYISEEEKIYLLLEPIFELNLKKFKSIEKSYPNLFEIITPEKFEKAFTKIPHWVFFSKTPETEKIAKKYNIDINKSKKVDKEDIWNFVIIERSLREKKEIKKNIDSNKNCKPFKKKRI